MITFLALALVSPSPVTGGQMASEISPPPTDKGQIVFFRRGRHTDSLWDSCPIAEQVGEQRTPMFKLGKDRYRVVTMMPGTHVFVTKTEVTDRLTLEVETGETYYVQCQIGVGGFASQPADLIPMGAEDFVKVLPKLKFEAKVAR